MSGRFRLDESGMTLVELVMALSIAGIVILALGAALFTGIRTTRDTNTSLSQSGTEQRIATYVTSDIQAADAVATSGTSTCGNQPALLETKTRSDALLTSSNVTVAYRLSAHVLTRQVCGPAPSTLTLGDNITSFAAIGTDTVTVTVGTATSPQVGGYAWTVNVRRRQA